MERTGDKWLSTSRTLSADAQKRIIDKLKPFAGTPFDFSIDPSREPQLLALIVGGTLEQAGWEWVPYPAGRVVLTLDGKPSCRILTGFAGLAVEIDLSKLNEWGTALQGLADALNTERLNTKANVATSNSPPTNAVHIYVGIKE